MTFNPPETPPKKDHDGLRERLFEAIDALRKGDILADDAKAMSLLAKEVNESHRVELDLEKSRAELAKLVNPQTQKRLK